VQVLGKDIQVRLIVGGEGGVPAEALQADACCSTYGELLASLLLASYRVDGPEAASVESTLHQYVLRIFGEEVRRLVKLFGDAYHRVTVPVITPLLMRMSRLALLYPWLRPLYTNLLLSNPSRLTSLALRAAKHYGLEVSNLRFRLRDVETPYPRTPLLPTRIARVVTDISIVQQLVTPQLIAEGLSRRPHPLLKDPLVGVKVGDAPVASKLVSFEDQLYVLTGVKKALATLERTGLHTTAKRVSVAGFTTAIVKDYRSPIAAKWLLAAVLTLHLPKPRLAARARLTTEIEYSYRLQELGFNVHEPLLVDPRRLRAAFRYVEGTDLASLLKKTNVPPQYRDLGITLAQLHRHGVSLWDTNPSNFVVTRLGTIAIVDLEQARPLKGVEEAAWDLVMGVYYSAIYSPRETPTRAKIVAEAYLDAGGDRAVVEEATKPKYMLPFIMAVAPTVLEKARRALLYVLHGGSTTRNF
jgi:tRNA A-37 threonylcarbamoyl transferase component Bud32